MCAANLLPYILPPALPHLQTGGLGDSSLEVVLVRLIAGLTTPRYGPRISQQRRHCYQHALMIKGEDAYTRRDTG